MKRIKDEVVVRSEKNNLEDKESFAHYLFKNKINCRLLLIAFAINILSFIIYKSYFPFPDFFSDSHGYIHAAQNNVKVFYRPWGYAYFLKLVHRFSDGHTFLIGVQFMLLFFASIFYFFSTDFLFRFTNLKIKYSSWILISFNPILLVLANLVGSDSLFATLSIAWFTLLLWIVKKQSWWALAAQVILLYCCFSTRYNALYYPVITILTFFLVTKASLHYKIIGSVVSVLIIFASYHSIKKDIERVTQADVFAGFSGWQMANNSLYIYKHIDTNKLELEGTELKQLNNVVQMYIDSIPEKELEGIKKGKTIGSIFLWDKNSPLRIYTYYYSITYKVSYLTAWYQVSNLFALYGKQVIMQNPVPYFKYYIFNNLNYFLLPDPEIMQSYNCTTTELPPSTLKWLKLNPGDIISKKPVIQSIIVTTYRYLHGFVLVFSLFIPAVYLFYQKKLMGKWRRTFVAPVLCWYLFFLGNAAFSIFAAIITLRYEVSWFVLVLCLPLWFLDNMKIATKTNLKAD